MINNEILSYITLDGYGPENKKWEVVRNILHDSKYYCEYSFHKSAGYNKYYTEPVFVIQTSNIMSVAWERQQIEEYLRVIDSQYTGIVGLTI